jgi:pimeloyl-ACP methyl ester carboxylesterase
VRIHYEVVGGGPPLVLHHGFTSNLLDEWQWNGYVDALKDEYQLVLLDARGHGESDKPHEPEAYGQKPMSGDVVAILDALGVERTHYWGYSMGGRVGWAMLRYHPDRLLSLIIGGSGAIGIETPARAAYRQESLARRRAAMAEIERDGRESWFARVRREAGESWDERFGARLEVADLAAWQALQQNQENEGLEVAARNAGVPCLVYAGDEDGLAYASARATADAIPNAQSLWLPGLNHQDAIRRGDLVLPHVLEFLAEVEASL